MATEATIRDLRAVLVRRAIAHLEGAARALRALDESSDSDAPMAYRLSVRALQLAGDVAELPAARE